jgi:hypothetical protein
MERAVERTGRLSVLRGFSANGGRAGVNPPNPRLRGRRFNLGHLIAVAAITVVCTGAALLSAIRKGETEPTDPVASARCLLTGQCSGALQLSDEPRSGFQREPDSPGFEPEPEWWDVLARAIAPEHRLEREPTWPEAKPRGKSSSAKTCIASAGLKKMPASLRERIVASTNTAAANACSKAVETLIPLRDQLYAGAFDNNGHDARMARFEHAAAGYVGACFNETILLNNGAPSAADEQFMKSHAGQIVMRRTLTWDSARPVCHAARVGQTVITAQHCIPTNSESYKVGRGPIPELGFRFFGQTKIHPLTLHRLGNGPRRMIDDRSRDYAVLQIVGAPDLAEKSQDFVGKLDLFADFFMISSNVYLRIAQKVRGDEVGFTYSTRTEHSSLCRPSFVAPNGLFLHACHTEAGVSGAPLFQRRNGRLVLVGIHNGVTEALEDPALSACAAGLPNYGISISSALAGELR